MIVKYQCLEKQKKSISELMKTMKARLCEISQSTQLENVPSCQIQDLSIYVNISDRCLKHFAAFICQHFA